MLKYLFISLLICLVINLPIGYALGVSSAIAVVLVLGIFFCLKANKAHLHR